MPSGLILSAPLFILLSTVGRMPKARQVLGQKAQIQLEILGSQESCFVIVAIVFW